MNEIFWRSPWPFRGVQIPCPSSPFFFLETPWFFLLFSRISLFFLSVFPSFPGDFRGSVGINYPCLFRGFPCLFQKQKKQERKDRVAARAIRANRFARIDSRKSFAIETPSFIARQAKTPEFPIRASHATKAQGYFSLSVKKVREKVSEWLPGSPGVGNSEKS